MAKGLLLFGLLAIFLVNSAQAGDGSVGPNEARILQAKEWVLNLLKKLEQTPIREWSITRNSGAGKQYTAVLNNLSIRGPGMAYAKSVVFDPKTDVLNILCNIRKVTISGQYKANGFIEGKQLYGSGNVQITISNIGIIAKLKLGVAGGNKVVVQNYDLSYTIGDIDVSASNLKVQGTWFPNKQVSQLILQDARKDIPRLSKVFTKVAQAVSDCYVAGLGLSQTLDRAKAVFVRS